ncbi:hypothetical protein Tco_0221918 [Tanacetum coccineum]
MWDARKVFDEMPERNSFTWATLISGKSVIKGSTELAFAIYRLEVSLQGTWQEHLHQFTDDQVCQGQKALDLRRLLNLRTMLSAHAIMNSLLNLRAERLELNVSVLPQSVLASLKIVFIMALQSHLHCVGVFTKASGLEDIPLTKESKDDSNNGVPELSLAIKPIVITSEPRGKWGPLVGGRMEKVVVGRRYGGVMVKEEVE